MRRAAGLALALMALAWAAAAACPAGGPPVGPSAPLTGLAPPLAILAIGSSSTEGAGAGGPSGAWPAALQARLTARLGAAEVVNAGRGGEDAAGALNRLRGLLAARRWGLVIWQAGTNDARDPRISETTFGATLTEGLAAIRAAGSRALLMDPQRWPADPDPPRTARFAAAMRGLGAPVLPRHAVMSQWDEATMAAMIAPDGLHMTAAAHACMAALIDAMLGGPPSAPTGPTGAVRGGRGEAEPSSDQTGRRPPEKAAAVGAGPAALGITTGAKATADPPAQDTAIAQADSGAPRSR